MLGIMFQKLLSKKWMFLCLLLGGVLLVATMTSFPIYQSAVFDTMLRDEFRKSLSLTGEWPAKLTFTLEAEGRKREDILRTQERMAGIGSRLGTETMENIYSYTLNQKMYQESVRNDVRTDDTRLGCISDLPEHVTMLAGEMYSETGIAQDGCVELVIDESLMRQKNFLVGDVLVYATIKNEDGSPFRMKIIGVFRRNEDDYFWEMGTDALGKVCLMNEQLFCAKFLGEDSQVHESVDCSYYYLFEYDSLEADRVNYMLNSIKKDECEGDTCIQLLENFGKKRPLISTTLLILQVPVLVLLGAFLLMVSGQMYELEKNEISVIKSRGSSGFQIFRLYLYQSIFVAVLSGFLGILLGVAFVQVLGSASNFLEFGLRRTLEIKYNLTVWLYLGAAVAGIVLILALPAIRHSRVSIVNLKQKKTVGKRSWWEMVFLDLICIAVGLYGYYSYSRNRAVLMENVLAGQSIDPLLYVSSAAFIIGMGLLFLRLQPLLVKLIYFLGQRFWHPAAYASFMESMKNGRKQHFIMLFLILTVSLGSFFATVARTILQNACNNVEYLDGADLVIKEVWKDNAAAAKVQKDNGVQVEVSYTEPDMTKYSSLETESYMKVIYDNTDAGSTATRVTISRRDGDLEVVFMGIHTREFGENTWLDRDLLEEHYYNYLNALADEPDGILISRSVQEQLECQVGSEIEYCYESSLGSGDAKVVRKYDMKARVVGIVDYWPGFEPTTSKLSPEGEVVTNKNYLLVANIGRLQQEFGVYTQPYEVWVSLKEGVSSGDVVSWVNDNDVRVEKYVNRVADLQETMEDPLLQGTNGVLTMSFLVMILLCAVGYLIYWIMSIRSRELAFGTLRAFGMHKGELFGMLIQEQILSGVSSILVGIGIGKLASKMYVPMLQMAYAASNQVIPIRLYSNPEDMLRLYGALALMMAICLIVLILLVFKLNVAKALKLGEE